MLVAELRDVDVHQPPVVGIVVHDLADHMRHALQLRRLKQSVDRPQRLAPQLLHVGLVARDDALENFFLGPVVVVEIADRNARLFGNVPHGCILKAAFAEQRQRGFENASPSLLGFLRDCSCDSSHVQARGAGLAKAAPRLGPPGEERFRMREKMNRLKKCMPPSTNRTMPTLSLTSSMAARNVSRLP